MMPVPRNPILRSEAPPRCRPAAPDRCGGARPSRSRTARSPSRSPARRCPRPARRCRRPRAAAARPGSRPGRRRKFSAISSVSTRAWLSASRTSAMPAAPRPPVPTPCASRSSASRSQRMMCSVISRARRGADVVQRRVLDVDGDLSAMRSSGTGAAFPCIRRSTRPARRPGRDPRPASCRGRRQGRPRSGGGRRPPCRPSAGSWAATSRPCCAGCAVVDEPVGLLQRVTRPEEQPRGAAVGEQHHPALVGALHHQRLDERRAVQHHLVPTGRRRRTTSSRFSGPHA